jgi:hypothetical protein
MWFIWVILMDAPVILDTVSPSQVDTVNGVLTICCYVTGSWAAPELVPYGVRYIQQKFWSTTLVWPIENTIIIRNGNYGKVLAFNTLIFCRRCRVIRLDKREHQGSVKHRYPPACVKRIKAKRRLHKCLWQLFDAWCYWTWFLWVEGIIRTIEVFANVLWSLQLVHLNPVVIFCRGNVSHHPRVAQQGSVVLQNSLYITDFYSQDKERSPRTMNSLMYNLWQSCIFLTIRTYGRRMRSTVYRYLYKVQQPMRNSCSCWWLDDPDEDPTGRHGVMEGETVDSMFRQQDPYGSPLRNLTGNDKHKILRHSTLERVQAQWSGMTSWNWKQAGTLWQLSHGPVQ